ncbi:hypothetical protein SM033_00031 [Vibrio phage vB_VpaM_sm033]|nr:hypothetical protein SM033_00031 [Vibrio phage vB_VpaM_sm033]
MDKSFYDGCKAIDHHLTHGVVFNVSFKDTSMILIYQNTIDDGLIREREFHFDEPVTIKHGNVLKSGVGSFRLPIKGKLKVYASKQPVRIDHSKPAYEPNQKKGKK